MAQQTKLLTSYLRRWQRARFHAAMRRRMSADLQRYLPAASQAVAAMRAGRDFLAMKPSDLPDFRWPLTRPHELPDVAEVYTTARVTMTVDAKLLDELAAQPPPPPLVAPWWWWSQRWRSGSQ